MRKVAAHRTLDDVRCGAVLLRDFVGNAVADCMAGLFTADGQVSEHELAEH